MSRTLKKTRIKDLPPKIQLQLKDSLTGSIPSFQVTIPGDNRTGTYRSYFDDTNVVNFKSYPSMSLAVGLTSDNSNLFYFDTTGSFVRNPELNTNIITSGVLRKGVGDNKIVISRPGQDLQPFKDDWHPSVDAISVTVSGAIQNLFYATGSKIADVGEGFDQPLWSKTKIEFDLTPSVEHSVSLYQSSSGTTGLNYPMCYWNNSSKKFEGIGTGNVFYTYNTANLSDVRRFLEDQPIGFGESLFEALGLPNPQINESRGQPVSNWGFPYHPKFHATSSNLIPLSSAIIAPFLLEKVVLEFSGAFDLGSLYGTIGVFHNVSVSNFFILNQRNPFSINISDQQTISYISGSISSFVTGASLPGSVNSRNTIRDLVTTLRVASYVSNSIGGPTANVMNAIEKLQADINIPVIEQGVSGNFGPPRWTGRFLVSGTVRSPLANQGMNSMMLHGPGTSVFMLSKLQNSNRNGLFTPSGRSYISDFSSGQVARSATQDGFTFNVLNSYSKPNPYLLLPTDNLVFGWSVPMARTFNEDTLGILEFNQQGGYLKFAAKPSKVIFYGSMIKEGKEIHSTTNQLLSSESIYEVIGS